MFSQRKFRMAMLSIVAFGLGLILTLNLGVAHSKCTNLTDLVAEHAEIDLMQAKQECKVLGSFKLFPWQHFALPGETIPEKYEVLFFPNGDTFSGTVDITFKSNTNARFVVLHGRHLNIRSLSMTKCSEIDPDCHSDMNAAVNQAAVDSFDFSCLEQGQIAIKMRDELEIGPRYKLNIKYSRQLDENMRSGIYKLRHGLCEILRTIMRILGFCVNSKSTYRKLQLYVFLKVFDVVFKSPISLM